MTPEANSLLLKIINGQGSEPLNAANKIIELNSVNNEVAGAVLGAIEAGKYFPPKTIAKIVGQSKSKKLYAATKDSLVTDQDSLLELHRQRYLDSEIERRLCGELYRVISDDSREYDLIYRKSAVESLRDNGTATALPTLEAILYEQTPKLQVKKVVSDAMPRNEIDGLYARELHQCEDEFVSLLRSAIQSIKNRGEESFQFETNNQVVGDVIEYQQKARDQLGRGEFDEALGTARKAAEAICRDIYVLQGMDKKSGKSPDDIKLQYLLEDIKKDIPQLIYSHLKALQIFGNIGSHHRNEEASKLTVDAVNTVLSHLSELAKWFKEFRENLSTQEDHKEI